MEEKQKLSRQEKRKNAMRDAKRISRRVGIKMQGVPRKERRKTSFDVVKSQLKSGKRRGDENPSTRTTQGD